MHTRAKTAVIGIDPGASGAVAINLNGRLFSVTSMKAIAVDELFANLFELLTDWHRMGIECSASIERITGMGRAQHKLSCSYGFCLGMLAANRKLFAGGIYAPLPQEWQRQWVCTTGLTYAQRKSTLHRRACSDDLAPRVAGNKITKDLADAVLLSLTLLKPEWQPNTLPF